MGLFDNFRKKPEEAKVEEKTESAEDSEGAKFNQPCALCGKQPTEVKWMGQFWHKRCKRQGRKLAGKMI